ncbi:MBL fold metallo-hydrolase [Roseospirillum parvum]|uniref:Glyoxylase, beta-lactamase superfamily II n=1 Tax=Roseospirillum parvum TaxID=83401 RepID=A0A1G7UMP2_9PROT|nr:MBL fold metallo-hydrolase [Roseospirillum parvum]SDG48763.1 Glyoxylase, beta-lactamase superfamily II [Roseospirillum parvum]
MTQPHPDVSAFFDPDTATVSYLVADPSSGRAAVIDPVRDYDPAAGRTGAASAEAIIEAARSRQLTVDWVLDTHVHADHLSALPLIQAALGGRTGIGARVPQVQALFAAAFGLDDLARDGRQFDHLFDDDETFQVGNITARAIATPGHTPACVSYLIGDALFTGDALFMPDFGTARCDFPGGDAGQLHDSLRRLLALPPETRVFVGHDYAPGGRQPAWESTIAEQRRDNIHVGATAGLDRDGFIEMRQGRDATLPMPRLILPSVQVNIAAGALPQADAEGRRFLKIPLDQF